MLFFSGPRRFLLACLPWGALNNFALLRKYVLLGQPSGPGVQTDQSLCSCAGTTPNAVTRHIFQRLQNLSKSFRSLVKTWKRLRNLSSPRPPSDTSVKQRMRTEHMQPHYTTPLRAAGGIPRLAGLNHIQSLGEFLATLHQLSTRMLLKNDRYRRGDLSALP